MKGLSTVGDLMTPHPISVTPETPLIEAANALTKGHFNGLPVVDKNNVLVGIVNEHDFLTKGSAIHLPTFLKLLQGFEVYHTDELGLSSDVKKILQMKVKDVMNNDPLTLTAGASIEEGLRAFAEHHRVNPIPIIDTDHKLLGVLSRYDLIKMFGAPSVVLGAQESDRSLDGNVNNFISDFEKQFLFVSKTRTRYWLLWSLLFTIVGAIIAFAFIVQIR
jgi:CBS domain-containing protein